MKGTEIYITVVFILSIGTYLISAIYTKTFIVESPKLLRWKSINNISMISTIIFVVLFVIVHFVS